MKTAAVIPAKGIGDALLMMIVSHQLLNEGYRVVTCHSSLQGMQDWFPEHDFGNRHDFSDFDLVVAENDNSPKIKELLRLRSKLSIFYPTYLASKHGPLSPLDQVFDPDLPMADNIGKGVANILSRSVVLKDNGIVIPEGLVHRRYRERVVIHPTSSKSEKNWDRKYFLKLASDLRKKGFNPVFAVSPEEREEWPEAPIISSLSELARLIYESGGVIGNDSLVGHLASNLQIPTVIVADDKERMKLWRPGWLPGKVATPPAWIPNWKFLRLREKHWQKWITPRKVLSLFHDVSSVS